MKLNKIRQLIFCLLLRFFRASHTFFSTIQCMIVSVIRKLMIAIVINEIHYMNTLYFWGRHPLIKHSMVIANLMNEYELNFMEKLNQYKCSNFRTRFNLFCFMRNVTCQHVHQLLSASANIIHIISKKYN